MLHSIYDQPAADAVHARTCSGIRPTRLASGGSGASRKALVLPGHRVTSCADRPRLA